MGFKTVQYLGIKFFSTIVAYVQLCFALITFAYDKVGAVLPTADLILNSFDCTAFPGSESALKVPI